MKVVRPTLRAYVYLRGAKPGIDADALFRLYTTFGEDPTIDAAGPNGERFSAWDYARKRCREMCGA